MWFISPFVPIFFRPSDDIFGVKSKYTQKFAPTDKILLEVISTGKDTVPTLKLNDVCSGTSRKLEWISWQMNENKILYYYVLSSLECGVYSIDIGDASSEPFLITDNERELEETTLIKYSMRNNRMRLDGVFWIGGIQHYFEFRVPGGFKDDDRNFSVDNEQFVSPYGNIVEMYSMDSTQSVFTLGNGIGCPIWFAELLNRLLCCSHVFFDGVRYARKDSSIPEKNQGVAGIKSYIFKQSLQEVKDDLSVIFGEEGGGSSGGGGGGSGSGVDILRLVDDPREPSDNNVFSSSRTLYEIKFYCEYYAKEYDKKFLRKDRDDRTPFKLAVGDKLTAENGLQIGESFIPGILTGSGGFFDQFANGELESLIIRRFLEVPELRFNRVLVELGDKWNAPGAGIFESVSPDKDADGNLLMTGTGYLKLEEGEYGAIAVGDICMGIFHSETSSDNAAADSDDSRGNFMFAGFYTTYFTITEITGSNNKQFRYQLRPISERWKLSMHPSSAMHFVSYGSFTDESRQTSQYTTRTYTRMLWKQNTWEISAANIAMQMGDLTNMSIHGLDMTGYSMYLNSVYFTGTIKQVKPDGTPIHTANDRGAWISGEKYDFYDRVSHNGSIWLCINEDGTSTEPADGHADWLKQVDKGQDGMDGVPGPAGADGKSYYTWIRYADDSLGNGISNSPVGKAYIGFAYNKETAVESSDPRDYKWSDIKGEAGVPGAPGADGKPTYTWIAYSDNANGSGMYQQPNDKTQYIGIAVNKNTATEGTNPADYTWSKFKGEQGDSISNAGDWHTGLIVPYLGITRMGGKAWMCKVKAGTTNPPMWTVTDKNGNRILQTQDGGKTYGYILTGEENTDEYQLLASDGLQGLQGMDGTDGIPGTPGKDGATTYFHIKYSAVANPTAAQMSETPNVFIGTYVDFTKEDSNDPAKYTWARFQGLQGAKGEQGVPGIGVDGKTYYLHIKYSNDGGKTFTGNNGEDTGKYIGVFTDLNQNDSNKPSDYKWSLIKGEQGDKGDSISNVGNWKTGLIVPYLGITRMGGKSWMCKVKAGTTNPPMWTVTDKNGNRILQTQDGGKTYGYILTGGVNTTEYELVAADGDPGKDGQDGEKGEPGKDGEKGEQGIQGCILRHSEWKAGVEYRNDEGLASGTRYLDVALVRDDKMATGWRAYKCKTTHTSAAANAPGNGTYWEEFGLNVTSIFASLIISKDASIDFMQGNQLLIKKSDGTVTAGLSGSQAGSKVRLWVGAPTPDNAPCRVLESGKIIGTDVELTGIINAVSGTIGGFEIGNGRIGTVASATGEAGGLSIYDNFFRVGGTDSSFMAGRNVFPSMLGGAFNATVRVTNNIRNSSTSYGFDVANYGLYVEVENGTKNYALFSPNAVVRATAAYGTQGKLLTINSSSYNLDLSQSNAILIYCPSQSYTINLPNEKSVCTMFGFNTLPSDFAYMFTIVAYPGTKAFTIPNVINHNNDNVSFDMGQGDSVMLLLTKIGGFRYQLINRQS